MIYIRADANKEIATGHIMRCLAIAEAFSDMGKEVSFVTADNEGEALVKNYGYPCIVLDTDWREPDSEMPKVSAILCENSPELLLVDSYSVTPEYLKHMSTLVRTAYIDDYMLRDVPCDVVINYDLEVRADHYKTVGGKPELLLGAAYTPLRREFRNPGPKEINGSVSNILVLTGGADHYHFAYNICETLAEHEEEYEGCSIDIVCGRYNEDYDRILELTNDKSYIRIHRSLDNIDLYMKKADVCLSAGGTTTRELAACGTPTLTYSFADNQIRGVESLQHSGLMNYLGDLRDEGFKYSRVSDELRSLCRDKKRRESESKILQRTIDGLGAVRIAEKLLK